MEKPEMFRISEELEAMPEIEKIRRIRVQQLNYFIFQRNTEELRQALSFHSDVKVNFEIWHVTNREKQYALQHEIGRLLHNFTVAAISLVDVTRRLYKGYESGVFPDYQARLDTDFVSDPLSRFVKDLRNYVAHYEAPPILSELNFSFLGEEQSMESQITLPSKTLLKYTDWSKPAKEYIAHCGDKIILDLVVDEYFQKVSKFYNWFYSRLNDIHAVDLSLIEAKKEELRRAYIPHPADLMQWEDHEE